MAYQKSEHTLTWQEKLLVRQQEVNVQQEGLIALQQQTIQHLTKLLRNPGESHPLSISPEPVDESIILCEHWSSEGKNIVSVNVEGVAHSAVILDLDDVSLINQILDCDERIKEYQGYRDGYERNVDFYQGKLDAPPDYRAGYRKNFLKRAIKYSLGRMRRLDELLEVAEDEKHGALKELVPSFETSFIHGDIRTKVNKNWMREINSWRQIYQTTADRPRDEGGEADESDSGYMSAGIEDNPVETQSVLR